MCVKLGSHIKERAYLRMKCLGEYLNVRDCTPDGQIKDAESMEETRYAYRL